MKHEIRLIREIKYDAGETTSANLPNQRIELTVDGNVCLDELLGQFESFIKACNYYPPENSHLEYVEGKY